MFQRFEYLDLKQRQRELLRDAELRRSLKQPKGPRSRGTWSVNSLRFRLSWAR